MHHKTAIHSILLVLATLVTFFWVSDPTLSPFALQVSALLLLTLLISRRLLNPPSFKLAESTIATITILLIVGTTGGLASPLFFLNYLLLFSLSLLLEPVLPLILGAALVTFYLLGTITTESGWRAVELLAFPFMTPLAYLLGIMYQKIKNQKLQLQRLSEKVEDLEEELVEEELKNNSVN